MSDSFATGGYIDGGFPPRSAGCVTLVHPDECFIKADDVHAGRWVCSRAGHPTATSDCHHSKADDPDA